MGAAKMRWLQMLFGLGMRIFVLIFAGHASIESAIALLGTWALRLPKMGTQVNNDRTLKRSAPDPLILLVGHTSHRQFFYFWGLL